jgi:hypothetical protein
MALRPGVTHMEPVKPCWEAIILQSENTAVEQALTFLPEWSFKFGSRSRLPEKKSSKSERKMKLQYSHGPCGPVIQNRNAGRNLWFSGSCYQPRKQNVIMGQIRQRACWPIRTACWFKKSTNFNFLFIFKFRIHFYRWWNKIITDPALQKLTRAQQKRKEQYYILTSRIKSESWMPHYHGNCTNITEKLVHFSLTPFGPRFLCSGHWTSNSLQCFVSYNPPLAEATITFVWTTLPVILFHYYYVKLDHLLVCSNRARKR